MHALIKTGGKQYRVAKDDYLKVEKLTVDEGQDIEFNEVLMLCDGDKSTVGAPFVENAKVVGEVMEHGKHRKIRIVKFKRRKHHLKRQGHRQRYTMVKIKSIEVDT